MGDKSAQPKSRLQPPGVPAHMRDRSALRLQLPNDAPPPSLVAKLKWLVRKSEDARALWEYHCDHEGGGERDPAKQSGTVLSVFLEEYDQQSTGADNKPAMSDTDGADNKPAMSAKGPGKGVKGAARSTEQVQCSVHGKKRSMQSMCNDGAGGYQCAPGSECKTGGGGGGRGDKGGGMAMMDMGMGMPNMAMNGESQPADLGTKAASLPRVPFTKAPDTQQGPRTPGIYQVTGDVGTDTSNNWRQQNAARADLPGSARPTKAPKLAAGEDEAMDRPPGVWEAPAPALPPSHPPPQQHHRHDALPPPLSHGPPVGYYGPPPGQHLAPHLLPPPLHPPPSQENLVVEVKRLQKTYGFLVCEAWHRYVDVHGEGQRDPSKHDSHFLEEFVREAEAAIARNADLVRQVKQRQASAPEALEAWHTMCDEEGEGIRDPKRHEAWFLQHYLDWLQEGGAQATAGEAEASAVPGGGGKSWGKGGGAWNSGKFKVDKSGGELGEFTGTIKSFGEGKNYGFIECEEAGQGDIFLHGDEKKGYRQGMTVKFECVLNKDGKANAINLKSGHFRDQGADDGRTELMQEPSDEEQPPHGSIGYDEGSDDGDVHPQVRLFVGELPDEAEDLDLEVHFCQYGEILESKIHRDPDTGVSQNFGIVAVAELNETEIGVMLGEAHTILGEPVVVRLADGERAGAAGSSDAMPEWRDQGQSVLLKKPKVRGKRVRPTIRRRHKGQGGTKSQAADTAADDEDAAPQAPASKVQLGDWMCGACGFSNRAHNQVCGGGGPLGCKAPGGGDA